MTLALGLTCHQIGVPFKVFEAAAEIKSLGIGINLQPTAVRELFDLGLENHLSKIGKWPGMHESIKHWLVSALTKPAPDQALFLRTRVLAQYKISTFFS